MGNSYSHDIEVNDGMSQKNEISGSQSKFNRYHSSHPTREAHFAGKYLYINECSIL